MLREGADAQLDAPDLVEMLDQRIGCDADEARRESALGYERTIGVRGEPTHGARDRNVLREVEVVGAKLARDLCHLDVAVVRQARNDRVRGKRREMRFERRGLARVDFVGVQVYKAVRL